MDAVAMSAVNSRSGTMSGMRTIGGGCVWELIRGAHKKFVGALSQQLSRAWVPQEWDLSSFRRHQGSCSKAKARGLMPDGTRRPGVQLPRFGFQLLVTQGSLRAERAGESCRKRFRIRRKRFHTGMDRVCP